MTGADSPSRVESSIGSSACIEGSSSPVNSKGIASSSCGVAVPDFRVFLSFLDFFPGTGNDQSSSTGAGVGITASSSWLDSSNVSAAARSVCLSASSDSCVASCTSIGSRSVSMTGVAVVISSSGTVDFRFFLSFFGFLPDTGNDQSSSAGVGAGMAGSSSLLGCSNCSAAAKSVCRRASGGV